MSYNAEWLKTSEDELDISALPTKTFDELQLGTTAGNSAQRKKDEHIDKVYHQCW